MSISYGYHFWGFSSIFQKLPSHKLIFLFTFFFRQRQVGGDSTMFSLAQRHLPRELLQDLRMPVPQPSKQRRAKRRRAEDEQDATEVT